MSLPNRLSPSLTLRLLASVLSAGLLLPAQAAELRVPEAFDVLQINGREFSLSLQREKKIPLQAGINEVTLEYDQIFDRPGSESHDRFVSAPITLRFVSDGTQDLRVQARVPERHEDAAAFARAPQLQLQTLSGTPVSLLAAVPVAAPAPSGSTVTTPTLIAPAMANPIATTQNPAVPVEAVPAEAIPVKAVTVTGTTLAPASAQVNIAPIAAPDALQMLNFWWQQATPAQRQAFLQQLQRQ